jgi:hypothetical protein
MVYGQNSHELCYAVFSNSIVFAFSTSVVGQPGPRGPSAVSRMRPAQGRQPDGAAGGECLLAPKLLHRPGKLAGVVTLIIFARLRGRNDPDDLRLISGTYDRVRVGCNDVCFSTIFGWGPGAFRVMNGVLTLSLNKPKLDNLASDIWKSAERLRGKFKAYEYQGVILPIIVIRRLECVLVDWREKKAAEVRKNRPKLNGTPFDKLIKELELNPKQCPFSNKTDWTLRKVYEEDHALLEENFRGYLNGFSKNVDDIIEHFNYRATLGQMVRNNRLAPIVNQYKELALGPDQLSGLEMGYVYEELLRRFSEQSGEEAGEHFTPREVIRLMVELLEIPIPERHFSIYDPASGTGGMLSVAKEHLLERARTPDEKARVENFVTVHGQELSPTNYAVCQGDLLIKNDRQATVRLGNSLIPHEPSSKEPGDQWPESKWRFNRMLSNPPFGVTWGVSHRIQTTGTQRFSGAKIFTSCVRVVCADSPLSRLPPARASILATTVKAIPDSAWARRVVSPVR